MSDTEGSLKYFDAIHNFFPLSRLRERVARSAGRGFFVYRLYDNITKPNTLSLRDAAKLRHSTYRTQAGEGKI